MIIKIQSWHSMTWIQVGSYVFQNFTGLYILSSNCFQNHFDSFPFQHNENTDWKEAITNNLHFPQDPILSAVCFLSRNNCFLLHQQGEGYQRNLLKTLLASNNHLNPTWMSSLQSQRRMGPFCRLHLPLLPGFWIPSCPASTELLSWLFFFFKIVPR